MAKREVKVTMCDRCPPNRAKEATETVTFGLAARKWTIDLCHEHYRQLDRDIYGWALLAREVEEAAPVKRFTEESKEAGKRLAELRAKQAEKTVTLKEVPAKAMHLSGPLPAGLPPEAGEWVFTDHAVQRMKERKISAVQALRAACTPDIIRESEDKNANVMVHVCNGIKAVVNDVDMVIVTVAKEDRVAWTKTS
jgi:hypothetical protein